MEEFYRTVEMIRNQVDLETFREMVNSQGKQLIIFGAGDCGHKVYDMLHRVGIEVSCFCDNLGQADKDMITGIRVVKPEFLDNTDENIVVLVSVVEDEDRDSICRQLRAQGFAGKQILVMREYYDRLTVEWLESHLEEYKKAYQLLADDFSRRVYLARMRKMFLMRSMADVVRPHEESYFDEKVKLTDREVFIDCGGFDGDTSLEFIDRCGGKYGRIVIFEPELSKKEAIERNLGKNSCELHMCGVWSKNTTLQFEAKGTDGSHVAEGEGNCQVPVVALDEVVYDYAPTFIKMDIEGAEQEALEGCRKIIRDYRPKLAICLYHKPDDLFRIPVMVKEMNPEYRIYVRQYSDTKYETVMYAL
ncbi:MAG: FkbM family methyltransferase [Lachnospiraceae bacterium]|nr:FkbM family methyltransferase [Lachnospiraceae bacterium]